MLCTNGLATPYVIAHIDDLGSGAGHNARRRTSTGREGVSAHREPAGNWLQLRSTWTGTPSRTTRFQKCAWACDHARSRLDHSAAGKKYWTTRRRPDGGASRLELSSGVGLACSLNSDRDCSRTHGHRYPAWIRRAKGDDTTWTPRVWSGASLAAAPSTLALAVQQAAIRVSPSGGSCSLKSPARRGSVWAAASAPTAVRLEPALGLVGLACRCCGGRHALQYGKWPTAGRGWPASARSSRPGRAPRPPPRSR